MATLLESVTWVAYQATIKDYLGVAGSGEDAYLQGILNAAVVSGDSYLNNPFVDADEVDIPIPEGVLIGVWEWMRIVRNGYISNQTPGATSVKTRDLTEAYGAGGINPLSQALNAAKPYWLPHRCGLWR